MFGNSQSGNINDQIDALRYRMDEVVKSIKKSKDNIISCNYEISKDAIHVIQLIKNLASQIYDQNLLQNFGVNSIEVFKTQIKIAEDWAEIFKQKANEAFNNPNFKEK